MRRDRRRLDLFERGKGRHPSVTEFTKRLRSTVDELMTDTDQYARMIEGMFGIEVIRYDQIPAHIAKVREFEAKLARYAALS
jgi:hypothetical protein